MTNTGSAIFNKFSSQEDVEAYLKRPQKSGMMNLVDIILSKVVSILIFISISF